MTQAESKLPAAAFCFQGCGDGWFRQRFNQLITVDLKDIKAIIDLMKKNSVSEFELEKQEFKIRLKRGTNGGGGGAIYEEAPVVAYMPPAAIAGSSAVSAAAPPAVTSEVEIKSPMIG